MKRLFGIVMLAGLMLQASAEISYPVDVANDRFTFKLGELTKRSVRWPREDGQALTGAATNLVVLRELRAAEPSYDPATERLGPAIWVDDEQAGTATLTRSVIALTPEEIAARAEAADREAKRQQLANAIATLRSWADDAENVTVTSGNAVATLQVTVGRLGIFFDRFADMLEVQGVDQ